MRRGYELRALQVSRGRPSLRPANCAAASARLEATRRSPTSAFAGRRCSDGSRSRACWQVQRHALEHRGRVGGVTARRGAARTDSSVCLLRAPGCPLEHRGRVCRHRCPWMRCQTGFGSVPAGEYEDILLNSEVMSAGVAAVGSAGRTDSSLCLLRVPGYPLERRGRVRRHRCPLMRCQNRFVGVPAGAYKEILFDPEVEYTGISARGCSARTDSSGGVLASARTSS